MRIRFTRAPSGESTVDVGKIVRVSWKIFTSHLGICLMAGLFDLMLPVLGVIFLVIPVAACVAMFQGEPEFAILGSVTIAGLGVAYIAAAIGVSHCRFFLALARGERPGIRQLLHVGKFIPRMFAAGIVFWVFFTLGFLCCFLPGLLGLYIALAVRPVSGRPRRPGLRISRRGAKSDHANISGSPP